MVNVGDRSSPNNAIERTADPRHASCGAGAAPRVAVRSWLTLGLSKKAKKRLRTLVMAWQLL